MSIKSIIAIVLAMCGSFATILAVVGYMAQPEPGHRKRHPGAVVRPMNPELRAPTGSRSEEPERQSEMSRRGTSAGDQTRRIIPDVPTEGEPIPLPDIVPADLVDQMEAALTPEQISSMEKEAATRLQGVESSLSQQVMALKKSRDAMLDQLADELRGQTPSAAGTLLLSLDDELAALTLKRLTRTQRRTILAQIPAKRRARIERHLR